MNQGTSIRIVCVFFLGKKDINEYINANKCPTFNKFGIKICCDLWFGRFCLTKLLHRPKRRSSSIVASVLLRIIPESNQFWYYNCSVMTQLRFVRIKSHLSDHQNSLKTNTERFLHDIHYSCFLPRISHAQSALTLICSNIAYTSEYIWVRIRWAYVS